LFLSTSCFDIFIDTIDRIYCSTSSHQVIRSFITNEANTSTVIAGGTSWGSAPDQLDEPRGLFVDDQFNLYVADCYNNRVQLFRPGQRNGTTVAGNATFPLSCPTGVVLDADNYLFIVDYRGHRIMRSDPQGFHCIAACSGVAGNASNQLWEPNRIAFDTHGNLFISDTRNSRVQ
jgi:sugar lactone lactonase YvrE